MYDINVAFGEKNALAYQVCNMFIFVVYACVMRKCVCVNEVTKNDRLQFVLNISFVFILVIVIITFDLHFGFYIIIFFFSFLFAFCFNKRYQFYINCKQFSVCPLQTNQRSLRTWPLCRFLYTSLIFLYIL